MSRKKLHLLVNAVSLGVILLGLAFLFHGPTSVLIWEKLRLPNLALWWNPDGALALQIGRYYFQPEKESYNIERAREYFEKAARFDATLPHVWYWLARIEFVNGNLKSALHKINRQITIYGDALPQAYYVRGLIHGFLDHFDEAEADFKKALAVGDKTNWAIHNDLAWVYFRGGDYQKAADISQAGLRFDAANFWLLTALGTAFLNQGKTEDAETVLLRAQERSQRLTEADVLHAYPGNDPQRAPERLAAIRQIADFNLATARTKQRVDLSKESVSLPRIPFRFASFSPAGPSGGVVISACAAADDYPPPDYAPPDYPPPPPPCNDIGLRAYDGTGVIRIDTEAGSPTSPLRIHKGGTTYGIKLVPPTSPDASRIRIQTPSGVMAIKKCT